MPALPPERIATVWELFKQFTYWFMGINLVATTLFTFIAVFYGGRDLFRLLHDLRTAEIDYTDDGRVLEGGGTLCRKCGYELIGSVSPRCPQCGAEIPHDQRARIPTLVSPTT